MNLDNFAEQIAETRAERGQSMREVAAETGLRVSTIHKAEHGGDVRLSTVRALVGWLAHPLDPTHHDKAVES